jgi:hypothetical protein
MFLGPRSYQWHLKDLVALTECLQVVLGLGGIAIYIKLGIKRIKPSGLHNNSDCADKVAAPKGDKQTWRRRGQQL